MFRTCPATRRKLGNLTLRETLARHREDKSCAACHAAVRFDRAGVTKVTGPSANFARSTWAAGPSTPGPTFPGGGEAKGVDGLRAYLDERRGEEFVDNLCRKLLAYGLGRSVLPSDDETIEAMRERLAASGDRFSSLVETIVTSPQFLNKRVESGNAED